MKPGREPRPLPWWAAAALTLLTLALLASWILNTVVLFSVVSRVNSIEDRQCSAFTEFRDFELLHHVKPAITIPEICR